MSQKFRLFASVAVPFVSLPLMIQPVAALPLTPAVDTGPMPGLVQVQQEDPLVPRKRKAQEEEGGAEQQKQGGGGERKQAPQAQQEEQPRRQRQADQDQGGGQQPQRRQQQADQDQGEGMRPPQRRQQQADEDQGGSERPQRRQQQADEDQGGSERPQRRQQQADQDQGEGMRPPQRRQQQADQDQDGSQQPQRRQQQQAAPETKQPAAREPEQLRPPVAPEGGERPRRNAQDKNAAPAENQAETPKPPRANDRAATPQTQPERPPRGNAQGQAPAPDDGTAQGIRPPQPATDSPATGTRQAQDPQLRRQQPAEGQQTAPSQEQPAQQQAQPEQPRTPEQVDRARQIARDPASAREGEQVVLPVENGAAVLDSAKEQPARPRRDGERPRRQPAQEAEQQQLAPPKSDAEAQAGATFSREQEQQVRTMIEERGERLDRRPQFERPQGWRFGEEISGSRDRERDRDGARVIISIDDQNFVRHDDSRRFYDRDGRQPEYERLRDGQVREVIVRDDGTRIVTIRNRYGEIVRRSRVVRGGDEYVLYYAPELVEARRGPDYVWRDPGEDLPPMRLTVPIEDYIIDTSSEPDRDYYEFLEQPPVERVERVYTLDEVRYSARIRDKVPRIDLDTITFATGSAEIPMNQASSLRKVADAINKVLEKDPAETFLIEGHTDAVGADQDNLILSDERAESVARVLTDAFAIPPENLTTQGYGEQYLKVRTDGPNQENRRVTVRRITPLVKPVASKQ